MAKGRGYYSERWKVVNLWEVQVVVHVTDDLSEKEVVDFYRIALEAENYEYCEALEAEANKRGFTLIKTKK